jgi:phospholipid/cholesterol/gamma-HCH transport system substrate-binding protein
MISRSVKFQLVVFVVITLLGVSYVGATYAQLDKLVRDTSYDVTAHFVESGGVFDGAEVSYRGVKIGRVTELILTEAGVDVVLSIENGSAPIPEQSRALVGNRSAVGEQFVELQPLESSGPYLEDGSEIPLERTGIPISSTKWLLGTDRLVNSVDKQNLRTVVTELGEGFADAGEDLGQIIDASTAFIETADESFDVTAALLRDGNKVLGSQLASASALRGFARDLGLVSETLATSDADLRRIIANGSATATQLRVFLEQNQVDLGQLINNLVTTGEVVVKHLDGVRQILILYPYVVSGGWTVVDNNENGVLNAHFGLILTQEPANCHAGYEDTDRRFGQNTGNRPMVETVGCTEPQATSNARGSQWAPRVATGGSRTIAAYDRSTGKVTYADDTAFVEAPLSSGDFAGYGADSWAWLLLRPLAAHR